MLFLWQCCHDLYAYQLARQHEVVHREPDDKNSCRSRMLMLWRARARRQTNHKMAAEMTRTIINTDGEPLASLS